MLSLKSLKTLLGFVLLGVVAAWMGCSDSAPVASRPAGKATCSLCEFLGDDAYTATDGLAAPESPDSTQTDADADSTQAETDADADSTQAATVEFADANLEQAVREALDRPSGPLTPADLAALTELDASYKNIESVAGLEHATALTTLYLRGNAITDVSPLASLTNLHTLSLWGNKVADVSPLASLISLRKLDMWGNAITDVQPLAGLTNLQFLQLGDNEIEDVSPLASLTNLQWLGVMENALSQHAANQQLAAAIASGLRVQSYIEKYRRVETVQVSRTEPEEQTEPALYWTDGETDKIQRANLDGKQVKDLIDDAMVLNTPAGIALDLVSGRIYWADLNADKIQRASLDGKQVEDLTPRINSFLPDGEELLNPWDIELDLARGKMYWTDWGHNKIQRANLDGSQVEDLVTSLDDPYHIELDLAGGKMYWTDGGTDKIQRANLYGPLETEDLVTSTDDGLDDPSGIALDLAGGKMYWTDFGTDKIQRADLDREPGDPVEDLVTSGLQLPTDIALDLVNRKMYWTDYGTDKIQRADLDREPGDPVEDLVTDGLMQPIGIALGTR